MKILKTLVVLSFALALFSCSVSNIEPSALESNPDTQLSASTTDKAVVRDLTITSVFVRSFNTNTIWYYADVRNIGNTAIPLSQISIQGFIKRSGLADVPAGGTILATSGYLNPGQTRRVYWSCSIKLNLVTLTSYSYLSVTVDYSNRIPESNESNNTRTVRIPFYKPDLYGYSGSATVSSDKRRVDWSCTLKNYGLLTANTSNCVIQAWISTDTKVDSSDYAAGGYVLGPFGLSSLAYNKTAPIKFGASVNPAWYKAGRTAYLLIQIDRNNSVNEGRETNNIVAIRIN